MSKGTGEVAFWKGYPGRASLRRWHLSRDLNEESIIEGTEEVFLAEGALCAKALRQNDLDKLRNRRKTSDGGNS